LKEKTKNLTQRAQRRRGKEAEKKQKRSRKEPEKNRSKDRPLQRRTI
jgi:hypothetical protein